MKKSQQNRDALKEFMESLAPLQHCLQSGAAKAGLLARTRPGFSEKTRARQIRRTEPGVGMH